MQASGALSAEEFELRYTRATGKVRMSRGLWSRYLRGETLPQSGVSRGRRSLIERLDLEYPGTGDIFFHPVWKLLDFRQLLSPEQLLKKYCLLDEEIWLQFVACIEQLRPEAPAIPATFWSLNQSPAVRKMRLSQLSGLDGVTACLIEGRMGHLSQVEDRFVTSLLIAGRHFQVLSKHAPFQSTRMRSALLAMEGHCIAYVDGMTVAASSCGEAHTLLRSKAREWQINWIKRSQAHMATLSPSSLRAFRVWLKSALASSLNKPSAVQWEVLPK